MRAGVPFLGVRRGGPKISASDPENALFQRQEETNLSVNGDVSSGPALAGLGQPAMKASSEARSPDESR